VWIVVRVFCFSAFIFLSLKLCLLVSWYLVEKQLLRRPHFPCPVCKAVVKRGALSNKTADETEVERDAKIRKRLKAIFNKPESHFGTLREYHDYEELVEELVYNLVHGVDVDASNARVEQYRVANADSIPINQSKRIEEERRVRQTIEDERRVAEGLAQSFTAADRNEKLKKLMDGRKVNTVLLGDVDEALGSTLSLLQQRSVSQVDEESATLVAESSSQADLVALANSSAPGVARGQAQHNAFLLFVGQRKEPRVASANPVRPPAGVDVRRVGGYDRSCELERNRGELRASIKCCR
jgi:hypothetical protein